MHEHDESIYAHAHDAMTREETVAMLRYMLEHNEHHIEELESLAQELAKLGMADQAGEVKAAIADYRTGNGRLADVLAGLADQA